MDPRPSQPQHFPAHPDGLLAAVAWVEAEADVLGIAPADVVRLLVLLDELFANTLMHGGVAAAAATVNLRLERKDDVLVFVYSDAGLAFNPLDSADHGEANLASGTPGGLGLRILRSFCEWLSYARCEERNVTTMGIALTQRTLHR